MRLPTTVVPVAGLFLLAVAGLAEPMRVASEPSGAEVWIGPADQPMLYKKGITPCDLALSPTSLPATIVIRKPGYLPAYRTVASQGGTVSAALASCEDPATYTRLPWMRSAPSDFQKHRPPIWLVGVGFAPAVTHRVEAGFTERVFAWSPDGSGALVIGYETDDELLAAVGVGRKGEDRTAADLWFVPIAGEPRLVYRWVSQPDKREYLIPDADFSPNPRWVVYAPEPDNREFLRLRELATGKERTIASEPAATLFLPHFSPTGRILTCLRHLVREVDNEDRPAPRDGPATQRTQVQVMSWDGSGRHTVADDASGDYWAVVSPDEKLVAYVTADRGVAVVPVGGGARRVILPAGDWKAVGAPEWSPDGDRVAVACCSAEERQWELGGRARIPDHQRVRWADVGGKTSGFARGCGLVRWHDNASLLVRTVGYADGSDIAYYQLVVMGLDGQVRKVLAKPTALPARRALAPTPYLRRLEDPPDPFPLDGPPAAPGVPEPPAPPALGAQPPPPPAPPALPPGTPAGSPTRPPKPPASATPPAAGPALPPAPDDGSDDTSGFAPPPYRPVSPPDGQPDDLGPDPRDPHCLLDNLNPADVWLSVGPTIPQEGGVQ